MKLIDLDTLQAHTQDPSFVAFGSSSRACSSTEGPRFVRLGHSGSVHLGSLLNVLRISCSLASASQWLLLRRISTEMSPLQIPEKSLDKERDDSPQQRPSGDVEAAGGQGPVVNGDEPEDDEDSSPERDPVPPIRPSPRPRRRRLSTYESVDSGVNLEDDRIGGSARTPPTRL